jgi:hypothetical protein
MRVSDGGGGLARAVRKRMEMERVLMVLTVGHGRWEIGYGCGHPDLLAVRQIGRGVHSRDHLRSWVRQCTVLTIKQHTFVASSRVIEVGHDARLRLMSIKGR